jgi:hypothetical protein
MNCLFKVLYMAYLEGNKDNLEECLKLHLINHLIKLHRAGSMIDYETDITALRLFIGRYGL